MGTSLHWLLFNFFVIAAVALDLAVFHRRPHKIGAKEAVLWTLIWITLSVAFGLAILLYAGRQPALNFSPATSSKKLSAWTICFSSW